jgi:ribonuclease G
VKTLNKLIVTKWMDQTLTALVSEKEVLELRLEDDSSVLGNIYIGKVKNIVKNLNSAFVDYGEEQTGYFSLSDNPQVLYASGKSGKLCIGDEIIVQIAKDAVKTKDPVLTSNLNFTGKYAVLTATNTTVGFSSKIADKAWKERMKPELEAVTGGEAGIIVRTNAYGADEALIREIRYLMEQFCHVKEIAPYRTCYSRLYKAEAEYIRALKSIPKGNLSEIVTDDISVYNSINEYLQAYEYETAKVLRFYEDPLLSLTALYSLENELKHACQKRVWLKSGGYLIIEPTEAMVVIDVNTGKYAGKKNLEDTIRMINLEAAHEICHQLRLRNLSGIIMIDFIDMKAEEDRAELMEVLRREVLRDSVKTSVIDMTPLGLVEMTRKKERRPLMEQIALKKINI